MSKRFVYFVIGLSLVLSGCNVVEKVIKDIPVPQMDELKAKYEGRPAWTRSVLIDIGPEGIIDRDTKVKIINLDLHWNGAVMVEGPKRRRITHGLNLKRPLTMEKVDKKMHELFWFKKPTYRYRMNLRKYGKRTAKAIFNHELFKGMKKEAALESWGFPDKINKVEIGEESQEQWIYNDIKNKNKKRYIFIVNGLVDHWQD